MAPETRKWQQRLCQLCKSKQIVLGLDCMCRELTACLVGAEFDKQRRLGLFSGEFRGKNSRLLIFAGEVWARAQKIK